MIYARFFFIFSLILSHLCRVFIFNDGKRVYGIQSVNTANQPSPRHMREQVREMARFDVRGGD